MKKQLRILLFAVMVVLMLTLTAVVAFASGEFVAKNSAGTQIGAYDTLAAAAGAVTDGGTVEVQASVTVSALQTLSNNVTYTIKGKTGAETITFEGSSAYLKITKGTVTMENINIISNAAYGVYFSGTSLTVNSGRFCTLQPTSNPLYFTGSSLTINDGFFTYLDNQEAADIDPDAEAPYYSSIEGTNSAIEHEGRYNKGVYLNTTGTVVINGGTFMAGNSIQAVQAAGSTKLNITGGRFYSYRAVCISSANATVNIYGGTFSGNPGQGNSKVIDLTGTGAKVTIYGGTFSSSSLGGKPTSKEGLVVASSADTQITIYGGNFACDSTTNTSAIIKLATTGNTLTIGSATTTYNGKTYGGTATFTKSGAGSIILTNEAGQTVKVSAGAFAVKEGGTLAGSLLFLNGADSTITLSGSATTYKTSGNAPVVSLGAGTLKINGGTFTSTGTDIINVAAENGSLTISNGTFTLEANALLKGGTILRTGIVVNPQNRNSHDQYYDPTEIYQTSSIDIKISGGRFIDNRANNSQIVDTTLGTSKLTVSGGMFLSHEKQAYFINASNAYGSDVPMDDNSPKAGFGGSQYYVYLYKVASNRAPVMDEGAAVALYPGYVDDEGNADYSGIRFTSYIPKAVLDTLGEGYTFGTLIAPADYVALAGAFTHTALNKLYTNATYADYGFDAETKPVFVDIQADRTISTASNGDVYFSGALVRIKEGNLDRNFAAIAYIRLASGTYFYSSYDAIDNARSMKDVAKAAYTDYRTSLDSENNIYIHQSMYNVSGLNYSRYTDVEQEMLVELSGYNQTLTYTTLALSSNYTIAYTAANLSANLKAAADALGAKMSTFATGSTKVTVVVGENASYASQIAAAKAEIDGEGYYIGVPDASSPTIVIYGTTNALTLQALTVFEKTYLRAGNVPIYEIVHTGAHLVSLNADVPFVFAHTRDGNFIAPYIGVSVDDKDTGIRFTPNAVTHLYNLENNGYVYGEDGKFVDYPVVAGIEIAANLTAGGGTVTNSDGYVYKFVPDNLVSNEFSIHIGLTSHAINNDLAGKDYGTYGYSIKNGIITITAFDDLTLRLAKQMFIDNLSDFLVDGTYQIPADFEYECYNNDGIAGAISAMDALETELATDKTATNQLAAFSFITKVPRPNLTLSGAVDVGDNTLQLYYNEGNVTVADYSAYLVRLVKEEGYKIYMAERVVEESRFVTLYNSTTNITLHLIYDAYAHADEEALSADSTLEKMFTPTLRVIAAEVDGSLVNLLPSEYLSLQKFTRVTDTMITNVQISAGSFGYCYIYTLEDGSFVVLDGGGSEDHAGNAALIYRTLYGLYEKAHGKAPSASNPINIAAWYLSHGHGDHYSTMNVFIPTYVSIASPTVTVESIITNFPSNDEIYNVMDPNPSLRNKLISGSWYTNGTSTPIPYYKVHTGQRFFIRNLEFEVMYTHEDIHPWAMNFYNNTSTVIRLTALDTNGTGAPVAGSAKVSNMDLGDLQARGSMVMRATWGDYAKSDMVITAHHGGNGVEAALYENIDAQVIWWAHTAANVKTYTNSASTSVYVKENLEWLANTRWLYIFPGNPLETPTETSTSGSEWSGTTTVTTTTHLNLTVTLTADGFPGLYNKTESDTETTLATKQANAQSALLTNLFAMQVQKVQTVKIKGVLGGSNSTTNTCTHTIGAQGAHGVTFGEGDFASSAAYTGNAFVLGRQNFPSYELPTTVVEPEGELGDKVEDNFEQDVPEIIW